MKNMNALKHGATLCGKRTPEYIAWNAMNQRCSNPKNPRFKDYGGRGIHVAEEWRADFAAFLRDMGERPSSGYSIDRIDNDGPYAPGNCRWTCSDRQMVNRRNTHWVDMGGTQIPLADLAKQHGIPANTLRFRVLNGWDLGRALSQPVRPKAGSLARKQHAHI